jgi:PKHD-type hydroxylase
MINPAPNGSWYLKYHHSEAWAFVDNLFTAEECDRIKALAAELPVQEAKVGKDKEAGDGGELDLILRKNTVSWMNSSDPEAAWIYRKLTDAVNTVNKQFWEYELDYIETLQYTIYDEHDDHYNGHIDMMLTGLHMRKLSFSLQLDDPETYTGCDLEMSSGGQTWVPTKRTQGTFIAFPSWLMHRVTPLTSGSRHSIVGWVCGPKFK